MQRNPQDIKDKAIVHNSQKNKSYDNAKNSLAAALVNLLGNFDVLLIESHGELFQTIYMSTIDILNDVNNSYSLMKVKAIDTAINDLCEVMTKSADSKNFDAILLYSCNKTTDDKEIEKAFHGKTTIKDAFAISRSLIPSLFQSKSEAALANALKKFKVAPDESKATQSVRNPTLTFFGDQVIRDVLLNKLRARRASYSQNNIKTCELDSCILKLAAIDLLYTVNDHTLLPLLDASVLGDISRWPRDNAKKLTPQQIFIAYSDFIAETSLHIETLYRKINWPLVLKYEDIGCSELAALLTKQSQATMLQIDVIHGIKYFSYVDHEQNKHRWTEIQFHHVMNQNPHLIKFLPLICAKEYLAYCIEKTPVVEPHPEMNNMGNFLLRILKKDFKEAFPNTPNDIFITKSATEKNKCIIIARHILDSLVTFLNSQAGLRTPIAKKVTDPKGSSHIEVLTLGLNFVMDQLQFNAQPVTAAMTQFSSSSNLSLSSSSSANAATPPAAKHVRPLRFLQIPVNPPTNTSPEAESKLHATPQPGASGKR